MMCNSRKALIAQISALDTQLQHQQMQLMRHKAFFAQQPHRLGLLLAALLIPAVWFGWKLEGEHWLEKIAKQLVELVSVVFVGYFKRQFINLLKASMS